MGTCINLWGITPDLQGWISRYFWDFSQSLEVDRGYDRGIDPQLLSVVRGFKGVWPEFATLKRLYMPAWIDEVVSAFILYFAANNHEMRRDLGGIRYYAYYFELYELVKLINLPEVSECLAYLLFGRRLTHPDQYFAPVDDDGVFEVGYWLADDITKMRAAWQRFSPHDAQWQKAFANGKIIGEPEIAYETIAEVLSELKPDEILLTTTG